jgi:hypothetical protein
MRTEHTHNGFKIIIEPGSGVHRGGFVWIVTRPDDTLLELSELSWPDQDEALRNAQNFIDVYSKP